MEQILEEEFEALMQAIKKNNKINVAILEVMVGASILAIKMERPLEDEEVNATYWYRS